MRLSELGRKDISRVWKDIFTMREKKVFLSLGSNLGSRVEQIRAALHRLSNKGLTLINRSSCYRTEPVENRAQPEFINLACEIGCSVSPRRLLSFCLDVERDLGRIRTEFKGPRTIDIDIIYYEKKILKIPGLQIPHSSRLSRRFVLEPLVEIAPDFVDPVNGKTLLQLLQECSDTARVNKLDCRFEFGLPVTVQDPELSEMTFKS
jgi:2-amino-4-hydroxy-6-hydroxymethyldihydropteridine diphosphokinase